MFTNETEFDFTRITILDDDADKEDVIIELSVDTVEIRQFDPAIGQYDLITLSPKMMLEILEAYKRPDGAYQTDIERY